MQILECRASTKASLSPRRAKHSLHPRLPGPHPSCCEDRPAGKPFTAFQVATSRTNYEDDFQIVDFQSIWCWSIIVQSWEAEIQCNNSNDCSKSGLCLPKLRPIQYESPAQMRSQIKEHSARICQHQVSSVLRNFYNFWTTHIIFGINVLDNEW